MLTLVLVLVAIWLILGVVGFMFKGLLWLGFIAIVLVVATVAIGWVRRKAVDK